ncbi:hypothetical protein Fmac_001866 [Flemingia macrophylla]|uniref:Uncharacterized protein n=1 Tax=Flemingia macrophylla TaxID=520843 RepID=A0ABD1NIW2_9FABA
MGGIVEVWVGELTKLREKVMAKKSLSSKAKEEQVVENEARKVIMAVQRDTATMSEETVCLLMDRFVPC